jgi:hypothetical protein
MSGTPTEDRNRWVERPEAAWALWAGIAGALAAAALSLQGIFSAGSAGATFGFLVVPFIAAAAAIPAAVWGAALGHVVLHARGKIRSPRPVLIAAVVAAASLPVTICYEIWRALSPEH